MEGLNMWRAIAIGMFLCASAHASAQASGDSLRSRLAKHVKESASVVEKGVTISGTLSVAGTDYACVEFTGQLGAATHCFPYTAINHIIESGAGITFDLR